MDMLLLKKVDLTAGGKTIGGQRSLQWVPIGLKLSGSVSNGLQLPTIFDFHD
jgi:hypothetical protein